MWLRLLAIRCSSRHLAIAKISCALFLGLVLNNFSYAEELTATQLSLCPVFQWEQDFQNKTYADLDEREDAYRDLLHQVQDYLALQKIDTEFSIDYNYSDHGHARLRVRPPRQAPDPTAPYDLIKLAYDLSLIGFDLEYGTLRSFKDPDYFQQGRYRYKPIIHHASHKWYFNGKVLNHLAELVQNNYFKKKLNSFEKLCSNPSTCDVISHFLLGYQNYQNLHVDLANPFPYLAIMVDKARQIYIPHRTFSRRTPHDGISTPWAFMHYDIVQALGNTALNLLEQYPVRSLGDQQEFIKFSRTYFGFQEELSLKMIDLNALLYILTERPEHVYFLASAKHPGALNVFINDTSSNLKFSYVINLPWPQEVLADGDTQPFYTSTAFQIFYRYHLDLFHRSLKIKHIMMQWKKTGPTAAADFLQAIVNLSERSPNLIGQMVHYHPWDYAQLRFFMQQAQALAIQDLQVVKEKRDRHKALRLPGDFDPTQCARQVLPPPEERTEN